MDMNMYAKKKPSTLAIIAGALFSILALGQFITLCQVFNFMNLVYFAAYVCIAVFAFMDRHDFFIAIPLGMTALLSAVAFFRAFGYSFYPGALRFILFLQLIALVGAFFIALVLTTDIIPSAKEQIKKLWFIPSAVIALSMLINTIFLIGKVSIGSILLQFLDFVILAAAFGSVLMWLSNYAELGSPAHPGADGGTAAAGAAYSAPSGAAGSANYAQYAPQQTGYVDMAKCVLLLIFTCGIYYYIWVYRTTAYLNRDETQPPRSASASLLLCLFVPFYSIYWTYQSAQRVDRIAKSKGLTSDISTLCLILAIFVGIVAPMIMQDKINLIARASGEPGAPAYAPPTYSQPVQQAAPQQSAAANIGVADELKKYKDLLDSGVITQEEFDEKKKQLLGL